MRTQSQQPIPGFSGKVFPGVLLAYKDVNNVKCYRAVIANHSGLVGIGVSATDASNRLRQLIIANINPTTSGCITDFSDEPIPYQVQLHDVFIERAVSALLNRGFQVRHYELAIHL
jgi:hypothetical protein